MLSDLNLIWYNKRALSKVIFHNWTNLHSAAREKMSNDPLFFFFFFTHCLVIDFDEMTFNHNHWHICP